jgi:molybdenum cofactor synthesis domain-containing protein
MIPIEQALRTVEKQTGRLKTESVGIADACARILAEDVKADMDMPPFNRSQMDGFAVRMSDVANAPVRLQIIGESVAGKGFDGRLKRGEAVRIMTGARVPIGADSVQKKEVAGEKGEFVDILERVKKGQNIVPKASEIKIGKKVFEKGERINELMIASLASFGYTKVKVYKQPRVSILATGSEIVSVDKKPAKDQIRDSNSWSLKALAENAGATAKILSRIKDDLNSLKKAIAKAAANSDILILSGGVSVGDYDFTKPALKELGAKIFFEKVALRPGKPTVFAKLGNCLVFGLPGNPVSAAVTFYLFVRKAILQMQRAKDCDLPQGFAALNKPVKGANGRDSYIPGKLGFRKDGRLSVEPLKWGGPSDFVSFAAADALIFVPRDEFVSKEAVAHILFL